MANDKITSIEASESKSELKRRAKDITELGMMLAERNISQLQGLPYPEIIAAIETYQRITKGNAKKRQMLYVGKLLRQVDLEVIERFVDRYDSASEHHQLLVHQLERWREQLIEDDPSVMDDISRQCPDIDRQHLRTLTREAKSVLKEEATTSKSHRAFKKLFQYLKQISDQSLITADAKQAVDDELDREN